MYPSQMAIIRLRQFLFIVLALFFAFAGSAFADTNDCVYKRMERGALFVAEPLRHGINLSRWWQDDQDRALTEDDIWRVRDSSFDFVRLPVSPAWLSIKDEAEQAKKIESLRCDIISLLNVGLNVVIDLHGSEAFQARLAANPNEAVPRIEDAWRKMASMVNTLPPNHVFLGVYNEPLIETEFWWRTQGRIIDDLRILFPDSVFIASSGPFNGWWNLTHKKPYDDTNVVYDFHFYDPVVFTHHGAEFLQADDTDKTLSPITYPVTPNFHFDMNEPAIKKYVEENWNSAAINKIMDEIVKWREFHRVRVACLEFGVYRPYVDDQSRYNWLRDTHDALEKAHIPWALWEYRGPFGLLDKDGNEDMKMLNVLGLKYGKIQTQ